MPQKVERSQSIVKQYRKQQSNKQIRNLEEQRDQVVQLNTRNGSGDNSHMLFLETIVLLL